MKFLIRQPHCIPVVGGAPTPDVSHPRRPTNRLATLNRVLFVLFAFAIFPTAAQAQKAKGAFFIAKLKNPVNGKTCTTSAEYDTGNDGASVAGPARIDWNCAVALGLGTVTNGKFIPVGGRSYTVNADIVNRVYV